MDLLEDKHLAPFRKEYLERDKEIQRYIGVYLSGVVIVFSWMLGPQSKSLNEMALGNDGYNIYAFLIISVVNALFITFLIYKSLDVHDTTQFITVLAKPNSLYAFWENWRRSKHSATKPVRTLYFIAIALLPTVMAIMLLFFTASKLFASDESLEKQLVKIDNARQDVRTTSTGSNQPPVPNVLPAAAQSLPALDVVAQRDHVKTVFRTARLLFLFVFALHLLPILFFWHNTVPTKHRWTAIAELKEAQATGVSPCANEALELDELIKNFDAPRLKDKLGTPTT